MLLYKMEIFFEFFYVLSMHSSFIGVSIYGRCRDQRNKAKKKRRKSSTDAKSFGQSKTSKWIWDEEKKKFNDEWIEWKRIDRNRFNSLGIVRRNLTAVETEKTQKRRKIYDAFCCCFCCWSDFEWTFFTFFFVTEIGVAAHHNNHDDVITLSRMCQLRIIIIKIKTKQNVIFLLVISEIHFVHSSCSWAADEMVDDWSDNESSYWRFGSKNDAREKIRNCN